ncbi:hypothetical protein [Planctobacterium marinum]|uniref:Spore coat protein U domain-containing protein n=1 Tax=Planctobacterium marinum TaxID=1631968 RepID=A0AA48KU08_9ALTE|nr:hypothetical protein MACH26_14790 [Planctobacterium marinum]BDX05960.1 hypothetical protein MACH26_14810 [Planctobacterium marinum]
MKTLIKTIAIITTAAALNANASISVEDTNETSFDIGGEILPECKVNSTASNGATGLDLASTTAQDVASVEIWCNTGQSTANTTYSSANGGVLKNDTHSGKDIAYLLDIADTSTGLSLTSDQEVSQSAGSDVEGASVAKTVSIRPQVNGFEYEGSYSDTITITVSYN